MKKLITVFAALFLLVAAGQAQTLESFFKKYSDDERFGFVSVGKGLMNMASGFANLDNSAKGVISKMNGIQILTLEETSNTPLVQSFVKELNSIVEKGNFETVVEARDKNERTYIYKRADNKNNADLLIVTKEPKETNVIWVKGKMTKEEMDKIMNDNKE